MTINFVVTSDSISIMLTFLSPIIVVLICIKMKGANDITLTGAGYKITRKSGNSSSVQHTDATGESTTPPITEDIKDVSQHKQKPDRLNEKDSDLNSGK